MSFQHLLSGVGLVKLGIGILGFISFALGTSCYFESDWKQKNLHSHCKFCTSPRREEAYSENELLEVKATCPDIGLEVFYVVIITSGFMISTLFIFAAAVWPKLQSQTKFKVVDMAFHGIFCPLIIISACTFIYSAAKIDQVLEHWDWDLTGCRGILSETQFLLGGKIVAGIISLKVGALYGIVAYNLFQEVRSGRDSQYYIAE